MQKIQGVYTAIITPFNSDGKLDEEGLDRNLRYQLDNGIDGIVALGTTGESPTLTHQEKVNVINISRKATSGKVPLVIGTGSYSTAQTIENTLLAEELGADAALIVTPYYNKPPQEGIYQHFKTVAESTKLPIIVYNHMGRTGQNIQTETLKRLADIPNIVAVKDSSGNLIQMSDVIEEIAFARSDFSVLSGDDQFAYPLMALGGHGLISVVSNLLPKQLRNMVHYAMEGNFANARELHFRLSPFLRVLYLETNPIGIKAAMSLCNMPAGSCRQPLCELRPENKEKLKKAISELQDRSGFLSAEELLLCAAY